MQSTYGRCLEWESKRKGKNMTIVTRSPCLRTDPIMWVQEHDQACFREGGPKRF